jgi:Mycothiol maleylpyruvate isomerase N-terminal domain
VIVASPEPASGRACTVTRVTSIRDVYVQTAHSAGRLLRAPAVAARWDAPSALAEFSVRGLAGHLAWQVLSVPRVLAEPTAGEPPIGLLDHYGNVKWLGADVNDDVNVDIRAGGERVAADGAADLAERVDAAARELPAILAAEPADRVVTLPWTGWSLRLDDFLVTRLMEIAVHSDDLAVSVGVSAPELAPAALDPVLALLSRLAVRRHGQASVLRALSRAERAPATIAAI